MAGNPENASLWTEADVYIAPIATADPATIADPFPAAWKLVGLLDGGDGFQQSRSEDTSDFFAWGGILVRTSRKNFKLVKKFSALEDNETTRSLIWPGSTETELIIPRPVPVKIGFELREGAKVKRVITKRYATVDVDGDITENESDLTKVTLAATIFPDAAGVLFSRQMTA